MVERKKGEQKGIEGMLESWHLMGVERKARERRGIEGMQESCDWGQMETQDRCHRDWQG
jgi:hypothetical protein